MKKNMPHYFNIPHLRKPVFNITCIHWNVFRTRRSEKFVKYMSRFRDWAEKNFQPGDAVVIETTGSVWDIYDIVAPLVSRTLVAHARKVRQIAEARVKTDKEDIRRLM